MKRFLATACKIAAILSSTAVFAFANIVPANGSTEQPTVMDSNSGSAQGQANDFVTCNLTQATPDTWQGGLT